jgi:integrin beta 3
MKHDGIAGTEKSMKKNAIVELSAQMVAGVKSFVSDSIRPLVVRLDDMESRIKSFAPQNVAAMLADAIKEIPIPKDGATGLSGKDGAAGERGEKGESGIAGRDGIDGKDGAMGVRGTIGETGPAGKDGIDGTRGVDGLPGEKGLQGEKGERGERGEPGPAGQDGAPGEQGQKGDPGPAGEKGVDGINGKDGSPGPQGGKGIDGAAGLNGKDADPEAIAALISKAVDSILPGLLAKAIESASPDLIAKTVALIPKPVDGRDGRDGAQGIAGRDGSNGVDGDPGQKGADGQDGLGLEDFDATLKDGKVIVLSLRKGEKDIVREIPLAIPVDRGVYKSGAEYLAGDCVTYGGSLWIAQRDTKSAPGTGDDFRLAVKRGRDGKDAA